MVFRNDTYIDDGIEYQLYVLDENGRHIRMSDLWEKWNYKHPNANPPVKKILSFDWNRGYVVNEITDLRVAGNKELFLVTTKTNRKWYMTAENSVLTHAGYTKLDRLGIGTTVVTMDNYKGYYGDTIKLETDGNSRVRAMLRNHQVPFEKLPTGGTKAKGYEIHVVDYDVPDRIWVSDWKVTLGLNNYRKEVSDILNLTLCFQDDIVSIVSKRYGKYTIGIYVDRPDDVVLTNGIVMKSTQTEVRND